MSLTIQENRLKLISPGLFLFLISFFFIIFESIGQEEPALLVTVKDPSCPGNGEISASLENVADPADLLYQLYLAPDPSPIATNETGVFTGLAEGNYSIQAQFMLEDDQLEISTEASLNSTFETLSFSILSQGLCEN